MSQQTDDDTVFAAARLEGSLKSRFESELEKQNIENKSVFIRQLLDEALRNREGADYPNYSPEELEQIIRRVVRDELGDTNTDHKT